MLSSFPTSWGSDSHNRWISLRGPGHHGGKLVEVQRHQLRHTQHSLRHRFAKDHIDLYGLNPAELMKIGGWDSMQVVYERYYGLSEGILDAVRGKTQAR